MGGIMPNFEDYKQDPKQKTKTSLKNFPLLSCDKARTIVFLKHLPSRSCVPSPTWLHWSSCSSTGRKFLMQQGHLGDLTGLSDPRLRGIDVQGRVEQFSSSKAWQKPIVEIWGCVDDFGQFTYSMPLSVMLQLGRCLKCFLCFRTLYSTR